MTDDRDSIALALGRLMLTVGSLERDVYGVAAIMGLLQHSSRLPAMKSMLGAIRDKLKTDGAPPWSTVVVPDLVEWTKSSGNVIEDRNTVVHASSIRQWNGADWDEARIVFRDGQKVPFSVASLDALRARATAQIESGYDLHRDLLITEPDGSHITPYALTMPSPRRTKALKEMARKGDHPLASLDAAARAWLA
ncbi:MULTISPECIES: hypothetical protein [unclassified Leifsonia]|uniref:hypothetical protein n=1 Tax=unclassified Leifsonia TaxID=2663824 RepID=UPI0006F51436|nr:MULTISPECIES: hypothetical protein [unclassified Leifsonia]KQX07327.1 hypothetical protein ASC59_05990 [Leifsonia sp. Root1293]KRA11609.1 hypothetical protein ASD61_05990 [Leifsonia sp. Root60]